MNIIGLQRLVGAWKLWVGLLGLIMIMVWAGDGFRARVAPGHLDNGRGRPVPAGAALLTVSNQMIAPVVQVAGTVNSERTIHLSARLTAYVRDVAVASGERVTAGDLLVTLDDRDLNEKRIAAEARLARAEAEFARIERLTASEAATPRDFDLAETTRIAARAELEQIQVMLSDTRIRAPIDGIITDRRIEPGDLAAAGQVLLAIYDPGRMWLEVPVPIRLLRHFPVGAEWPVTLDFPPLQLTGRVSERVGTIDPVTRTRLVKFQISADDAELLPGAFGRVWLTDDPYPGIRIPAAAIRWIGQLVLVDGVEDDRVVRRLITTGREDEAGVEVLSGLRAGDRVLATPLAGDGL